MRVRELDALVLGCLITFVTATATAQDTAAEAERAGEAYAAEDWKTAAQAYREITGEQTTNGRAWFRLGVSLRNLGELDEARAALEQGQAVGVPAQFAQYEIAKILILQDDTNAALETLEKLAGAGLTNVQGITTDAEFAGLSDNERFQDIVTNVRRNTQPCEEGAYRDFDFWIGNWDVADASGNHQGTNVIARGPGGCMLEENWTSAGGGAGTSLNYYDPTTGTWSQLWVSSGLLIKVEGGLKDGAMHLAGTSYYMANDDLRSFRGTWTPLADGRVRQYFEESTDGGETWAIWFDGYYTRRAEE